MRLPANRNGIGVTRVYQTAVRRNLLPFDTFLLSLNSEVDILQPLSHLNAVLKLATSVSIPKFKSEITIRQVRNRPWSKRIYDAAKKCRLEWWNWRQSGSPTDPADDTVKCMKSAKKKKKKKALRKEQRLESVQIFKSNLTKNVFVIFSRPARKNTGVTSIV